jgi:predicted CXXCH cytochrome family protein
MSARRELLLAAAGLGLVACAGLLGVRTPPAHPFEHRAHVVKGIACVRCHTRVASADASAPLDLPTTALCVSCHTQPHDRNPCGTCHGREEDRHGVAQAKQHLAFSHADHRGTTQGRCTRCHDTVQFHDGTLRPPMATCLGCHEHRDQWASRTCAPCHRDLQGERSRPMSHVVHGDDFLRAHGSAAASARDLCSTCHEESTCVGCHGVNVPALPSSWHFDRPSQADMHAAGFFARHSLEARSDPALCTTCHRDGEDCRDCHKARGLLEISSTQSSPHPADWVMARGGGRHGQEARLNPVACAACHGGAGESLCVGCHRVGGPGGSPHPPGFHSEKREGELPCRMCHTEGP